MERANETAAAAENAAQDVRETLAAIHAQTRESLDLLRSLVNLLLEQHNLREGPPLEDLIATLIVQQREIQTIARQTRADVRALLQGSRESPTRNGHTARPNGSASC